MSGRSLPNYELYKEKLETYCSACEISVEYKDYSGDGAYMPSKRKIVLDCDLPESTEIATWLHELGHSLDDTLYTKKGEQSYSKAFNAFYKDEATQEQKDLVVAAETRAWMYAKSIAKKLRIPLGKWFKEEEIEALNAYRGIE